MLNKIILALFIDKWPFDLKQEMDSSPSSCRVTSTDLPNHLSSPFSIVYRFR